MELSESQHRHSCDFVATLYLISAFFSAVENVT